MIVAPPLLPLPSLVLPLLFIPQDEFDLPLAIQCSHIGKSSSNLFIHFLFIHSLTHSFTHSLTHSLISGSIKMKIPWKSLGKDPIVVGIDELYVIVTPKLGQRS